MSGDDKRLTPRQREVRAIRAGIARRRAMPRVPARIVGPFCVIDKQRRSAQPQTIVFGVLIEFIRMTGEDRAIGLTAAD